LTLIMFDLDHFKRINDDHGHLAGDYVLKRLSDIVGEGIRKEECFARYGGEEFAILLPDTDLERGFTFADKIRGKIAATHFEFEENVIPVTTSMGVAGLRESDVPLSFVKRADEKLYEAKQGGRNRVCR
ncbi:MAG: GGDEF domain-containing protein, partial [Myxococcota bacterium]